MIDIDTTAHSLVVTCSACPSWRELCATRPAAWTVAAGHLTRTHGDVHAASKARAAAAVAGKRRRSPDSGVRGNLPDLTHGGTPARPAGDDDHAGAGVPGLAVV